MAFTPNSRYGDGSSTDKQITMLLVSHNWGFSPAKNTFMQSKISKPVMCHHHHHHQSFSHNDRQTKVEMHGCGKRSTSVSIWTAISICLLVHSDAFWTSREGGFDLLFSFKNIEYLDMFSVSFISLANISRCSISRKKKNDIRTTTIQQQQQKELV